MNKLNLEINFINHHQAQMFLKLLRIMSWYSNTGHTGTITVSMDGDGKFGMTTLVQMNNSDWKTIYSIVPFSDEEWEKMCQEHKEMQKSVNSKYRDNSDLQIGFS